MPSNYRIFNVPDSELMSNGDVIASILPQNIDDFVKFDSTFAIDYHLTIKNAVNKVRSIRSDQVVIDEMAEYTQNVRSTLSKCNDCYASVRFFVLRAFAKNYAVQNQFGIQSHAKARYSPNKMIVFMEDVSEVIDLYKNELITAGCNHQVFEEFYDLSKKLHHDHFKQIKFRKERILITQERIIKLNSLYKILKRVSQIAQIIYAKNKALLDMYSLPKQKTSRGNSSKSSID